MRLRTVQKDSITYTSAISGMGGTNWNLALALLEHMYTESIQRDHVAFNAAMASCQSDWRNAVALLEEHPAPDAASFGACISACEKSGEWQAAIFFLVHMSAVSVQQTAVTVAAAISACEKCVQWTMALAILATTTAQLDVISYNAAIAACEKGSSWNSALALLTRLMPASLEATAVTFSSAISSCAKAQRWCEVLELLEKAPFWETLACGAAIRACKNDWARVLQLCQQMTLANVFKDADIYSSAATACAMAGQIGHVHELLSELNRYEWFPGHGPGGET
eukprot:symbB.v1.2.008907.t1/scaffold560.1/size187392/2